jgi:hypothetical protein
MLHMFKAYVVNILPVLDYVAEVLHVATLAVTCKDSPCGRSGRTCATSEANVVGPHLQGHQQVWGA